MFMILKANIGTQQNSNIQCHCTVEHSVHYFPMTQIRAAMKVYENNFATAVNYNFTVSEIQI